MLLELNANVTDAWNVVPEHTMIDSNVQRVSPMKANLGNRVGVIVAANPLLPNHSSAYVINVTSYCVVSPYVFRIGRSFYDK